MFRVLAEAFGTCLQQVAAIRSGAATYDLYITNGGNFKGLPEQATIRVSRRFQPWTRNKMTSGGEPKQ